MLQTIRTGTEEGLAMKLIYIKTIYHRRGEPERATDLMSWHTSHGEQQNLSPSAV